MIKNKKSRNLINYLMVFFLLVSGPALAKAPAAGTVIKNQATATYKDSSGIEQTATSNLVETLIQQVGAFTLDKSQSRYGIAGQVTSFPHVLTNTGNGDDSFILGVSDNTGDSFNFDGINIYPDTNQDGVADSNTPITTTGVLALGESFYFVVSAEVPSSAVDGNTGDLTVTGTSNFDSTVKTNTDTVTVSDKAVVTVTKSISANSGVAGSGPYTVTLTYSNQSANDASDVTLVDDLPTGMTYINNSVEWSVTGSGAVLTGTDSQVTAVIAQVVSGDTGTISFEVMLDSGIDAQTLLNTGGFSYNNGSVIITGQETNTVPLEVISSPIVVANGSTSVNTDLTAEPVLQTTATLGSTVAFDNIIWNLGNSTDTFDISVDEANSSFPAGTTFTLYKSDGFTPLLDTDNSSMVDTGPLGSGEFYKVVLKAKLPMTATVGDNSGAGFSITKTAISAIDPSVSNPVTDNLGEITGSGVDITNVSAIGGIGVKGEGAGPENDAQTQIVIAPGESGVFQLYVNNTSNVADSFDLTFSKDKPFVVGTLPAGWSVSFHTDAGANNCSTLGPIVSNTAIVPPNSSKLICANISIATGIAFSDLATSIYFQAKSPLTGVSDIKHDAVYMTASHKLILEPDHRSQVEPGGTQTYVHNLHNPGNTIFTGITLSSTDSLSADGWTTKLYEDTDGDGDSIAASIAFKDSRFKDQVAGFRLEARHDDDRTYYGLQTNYVKRLDTDWSVLIKDTLRYDSPESGDDLIDNTLTVGLAFRPRTENKHHGLFFYQNKEERGGDNGDCSTHILSTHQNYEIQEDVLISGRFGGKRENCGDNVSEAVILDGRLTWDITNRFDVDIHAGALGTNNAKEVQYSLGAGINYLVKENLRLGVGYNVLGFKDADLDPENYNDEGLNIGLQYKFDENGLNWLTGEK